MDDLVNKPVTTVFVERPLGPLIKSRKGQDKVVR